MACHPANHAGVAADSLQPAKRRSPYRREEGKKVLAKQQACPMAPPPCPLRGKHHALGPAVRPGRRDLPRVLALEVQVLGHDMEPAVQAEFREQRPLGSRERLVRSDLPEGRCPNQAIGRLASADNQHLPETNTRRIRGAVAAMHLAAEDIAMLVDVDRVCMAEHDSRVAVEYGDAPLHERGAT